MDRATFPRSVRPIMQGTSFIRRVEVERLVSVMDPAERTRSAVPPKDAG